MRENIGLDNTTIESKQDDAFKKFVTENDYSGQDVTKAYYVLCGVSELDDSLSDEVNFIYTKMKEMSDEKYPINRFIEFAQEWTAAIDNFKKSVEGLDISDKEKKMLDSIVSNKRSGEMQIHVDGKAVISIEIPECKSSWELARELDVVLFSRLSRVKDREISIWFEESA